jgi:hypothetical protein
MASPKSSSDKLALEQGATTYVVDTDEADYDKIIHGVGAPTEKISPLGYHVDWISVVFLVSPPFNRLLHR